MDGFVDFFDGGSFCYWCCFGLFLVGWFLFGDLVVDDVVWRFERSLLSGGGYELWEFCGILGGFVLVKVYVFERDEYVKSVVVVLGFVVFYFCIFEVYELDKEDNYLFVDDLEMRKFYLD